MLRYWLGYEANSLHLESLPSVDLFTEFNGMTRIAFTSSWLIDWILFYVCLQLIYGYVDTNDDNDIAIDKLVLHSMKRVLLCHINGRPTVSDRR